MITAIVRYKLPVSIKRADCLTHFHKIAPSFGKIDGLIRKQFIWNENGIAGGVYQWDNIAQAKAFYQGPWLDGIIERYGSYPEIEYFTTFAVTETQTGEIALLETPNRKSA